MAAQVRVKFRYKNDLSIRSGLKLTALQFIFLDDGKRCHLEQGLQSNAGCFGRLRGPKLDLYMM